MSKDMESAGPLCAPYIAEMARGYESGEFSHPTRDNSGVRVYNHKPTLIEDHPFTPASAWDVQIGGDHYKDMAIQPTEFVLRNKLGPCEHMIIKYVCRYKKKGGREDLLKARHYIDILLEEEYPNAR